MIKKILVLLSIIIFNLASVYATSEYKNELVKVGFSNLGVHDVKITLYTAKPYSEPLRVLKKNDSEFVLILPETFNSAPQKPSISDVIGEITDVDIRLYSFVSNSNENGYTKIVIKTNGLTNLYPEAVDIGGGILVNNEVNKIVASKISPNSTISSYSDNNYVVKSNKTEKNDVVSNDNASKKMTTTSEQKSSVIIKNNDKQPQNKTTEVMSKNSVVDNKSVLEVDDSTLNEPLVNLPSPPESKIVFDDVNLVSSDDISDISNNNPEVVQKESKKKFEVTPYLLTVKKYLTNFNFNKFADYADYFKLFFVLIIFTLLGINLSKNIKRNKELLSEEFVDSKDEGKKEYSTFFKTLIESEIKGENAFILKKKDEVLPTAEEDIKKDEIIYPVKSHKEVLDIDQNLTWQEKFRALQKNKKVLLNQQDNDDNTNQNDETIVSGENMNIENPIKKLKEDFRAVRKILERKSGKLADNPIVNAYEKEQANKVEIISFEEYQKEVQPPKVQLNKTKPIKSKAPKVVSHLPLVGDKGLYLIDYNDKIALVGYINDRVFKLSSYKSLNKTTLYARLSESQNGKETYIVKFDDNKLLIDISQNDMQLKLTY